MLNEFSLSIKIENIYYFCNKNTNQTRRKQMKPYYIHILGIIFCLASCTPHSKHWETLMQVESFMEERPDSALTVLQELDKEDLSGKEEHAKYALLLSMAMDKNYIDRTDFEVLQPAIDYYRNHGTATDKLRTYYYEGRIYMNQSDHASAIIRFNRALTQGAKSDDVRTKARVHFAQANIYYNLYQFDKYVEENKQAAGFFKKVGLTQSYANCLIRIINGYTLLNDKENAQRYIDICQPMLSSLSIGKRNEFYSVYLIHLTNYGLEEDIISALEEYRTTIPKEKLDWLTIAKAYLTIGHYREALACVQKTIDKDIRFHAISTQIYKKLNQLDKALVSYQNYVSISDSIDLSTYKKNAQFIEEFHRNELKSIKEKERTDKVLFISILTVFVLLSICIGIRIRLVARTKQKEHLEVEKEKYRLQCLQIEEELGNLSRLLAQQHELSETTQQILAERVSLLNKFFATYIKSYGEPDSAINEEIEKLVTDKESFINSNRISFSGSHPKFIHYLEEKGLTEWEINYCCLYTLGLNGKEIGTYIKMRSHYNQSSIIREKLGIGEHETNLGIYLRKLLKEFSS